ncbi:Swi3-domain-containing protein [Pseudovirgaria hyperparasitica]|uniref:Chromosome segregation in meiosis protein n=1 Tax=Pseudovirgaria hyperparasitica TaxID=470096 RepID=A0A6A6WHK3_9PEZI|nr:Swi3-domain-containing protein [Pseudovirgaria hyperparasitica]KAF2761127.1 Swi3-domain-containing protein [Pseudovirgaria hyperparasitica]
MPGATTEASASRDDLDDLFNYDVSMDDVFRDVGNAPNDAEQTRTNAVNVKNDLGIEEEVKIVKKRQPIPKLDEARLLSAAGIPKLRKISKDRLRFKGKGHEFSDIARLLNTYQFWLDDLYPRAKFTDALVMVEKLGHKKTIQMMRRAWIDEGKPRVSEPDDYVDEYDVPRRPASEGLMNGDQANNEARESRLDARLAQSSRGQENASEPLSHTPNDDELDALLAEEQESHRNEGSGDQVDDDDLDALLAEEESIINATKSTAKPPKAHPEEEEFADEMEAMAEMGGMDDPW